MRVGIAPERAWEIWNLPEHVTKWCFASDDWHAPSAESDLRPGGKFKTAMAAKDGSAGFDFEGTYSKVEKPDRIEYVIADGRKVSVVFKHVLDGVEISETFETEDVNSAEMQRAGWQAILENFRKYAESLG